MTMIFLKWLWRTAFYVLLGSIFWWLIYLAFNKNITDQCISYILGEVAAGAFAGAIGAFIYTKYIDLSKLYFQLEPSNAVEASNLQMNYHNVSISKGADFIFYIMPFLGFFVIYGTEKSIIIGKSEIISAFLIGTWIALGFNSMFLQGMFRHKLQNTMRGYN